MIPTYNSVKTLERCLKSARQQSVAADEIIVVDKQSTDSSVELARSFGATVIQSSASRSKARNIGFRESRSDAILFVDSDMFLSKTILEECLDALKTNDALIIPEVSQGSGFWAECKILERQTYEGRESLEAARCFSRKALERLQGYDECLEAGEDWDLQFRTSLMGFSTGRISSQIIHFEGHLSLMRILRKKHFYGKTIRAYVSKNPQARIVQLNPLTRVFRPTLAVLPLDPVHGIGIFVMKSLEFLAAVTGHIGSKVTAFDDR